MLENMKRVTSFKAVIVMTKHDGTDPTLADVLAALTKAQLAFAMPAEPSTPIVISLNDLPPRKDTGYVAAPLVEQRKNLGNKETTPPIDCPF